MKKTILTIGTAILIIVGSVAFNSCGNSVEKNTITEQEGEQVYSCPMHPEITGVEGDTCSICGMDLTQ